MFRRFCPSARSLRLKGKKCRRFWALCQQGSVRRSCRKRRNTSILRWHFAECQTTAQNRRHFFPFKRKLRADGQFPAHLIKHISKTIARMLLSVCIRPQMNIFSTWWRRAKLISASALRRFQTSILNGRCWILSRFIWCFQPTTRLQIGKNQTHIEDHSPA